MSDGEIAVTICMARLSFVFVSLAEGQNICDNRSNEERERDNINE
jgi:hypothetical protein